MDLRDRLPTMAVPLREPDEVLLLDIQAALDTVYDRAYYADRVDYSAALPEPPLKPADAAWVQRMVEGWVVGRAVGRAVGTV